MAQFRVLAGRHETGTADQKKVYVKGELVESPHQLDKMFANQFERIGGPTEEPNDRDNTLNTSGRQGDDPEHLKQAAPRFRGARLEADDTGKKTQKLQSKNQEFDPEYQEEVKAAGKRKPQPAPEDDEDVDTQASDLGDDVTEEFEGAADAGLTVHKHAGDRVYRLARDGQQIGEDLKRKDAVAKAIKAESKRADAEGDDGDDE